MAWRALLTTTKAAALAHGTSTAKLSSQLIS